MSDAPDGLNPEEREIWTSSIPVETNPVMNPELQDMGVDTRIRSTRHTLHDPKPLLTTIAALRAENAGLQAQISSEREAYKRGYDVGLREGIDWDAEE